jgi:hypothetical protein
MSYGIYGIEKNMRNSVLTEFRGHPTLYMPSYVYMYQSNWRIQGFDPLKQQLQAIPDGILNSSIWMDENHWRMKGLISLQQQVQQAIQVVTLHADSIYVQFSIYGSEQLKDKRVWSPCTTSTNNAGSNPSCWLYQQYNIYGSEQLKDKRVWSLTQFWDPGQV